MDKSSRSGSSLEQSSFESGQRKVTVPHDGGSSIVAGEDNDGVLVHANLLYLRDHLTDGLVHGRDHGVVPLVDGRVDVRVELLVLVRNIVRGVRGLECGVEEEWTCCVLRCMIVENINYSVSIEMLK